MVRSDIPGARVAVAAVAVVFASIVALALVPGPASAAPFPKPISGHVYVGDSGHPAVGASVLIEVWDGGASPSYTSETVLADEDGFYTITIAGENWDEGDTLKAVASYESDQASTSVAADDGPQTIDVIFPYAIPQLAGVAGALVALAAVGVLALFFLRRGMRADGSR